MPVIEFDVSSSDPEAAVAGTFESPKPGIYPALVKSMTPGFSKGKDGNEDKNRPRIEVIFQVTGPQFKGSQLWYYLTFGESALWKLDQFLQVFGIATKNRRKGKFDTNKIVNKPCKVRVRAGKDLDGNYRGEVAAVLPPGDDTPTGADDDTEDIFGTSETTTDGDEPPDDQAIAEEEPSAESGDDDDDMIIDDTEEDTSAPLTEEDLKAMTPPEVAEVAKEFEIPVKGKKKSQVIAEILEAAAAQAINSDDDEEMPF